MRDAKVDPAEKERDEMRNFINSCVDQLNVQVRVLGLVTVASCLARLLLTHTAVTDNTSDGHV